MLNPVRTASYCRLPTHDITRRIASGMRYTKAAPADKKDLNNDQKPKSGEDTSLRGGGYAKRSDEEGFGAVYGGNPSLSKEDEAKIVHGNSPEYDQNKRSS